MNVIYSRGNSRLIKHKNGACVAIGIFDGVHRGHQYLINAMLRRAKALKARAVVITFFPHPAHVLAPKPSLRYLSSLAQRLKRLDDLGVPDVLVVRFTKQFAAVAPEAFIRNCLANCLNAKAVYVGEDFKFGRDRAGDTHLFRKLSEMYGYELHAMPAFKQGGETISSTRIRALIAEGKCKQAAKLLGRPFTIEGKVVKGSGRGKGLGFPTANVRPLEKKALLPANGVYAVRVWWKGKVLKGAANIGTRPSFHERKPHVHLEVFIFDFHHNLYGQSVEVEFIEYIRPECKFSSVEALTAQISKDIAHSRKILK